MIYIPDNERPRRSLSGSDETYMEYQIIHDKKTIEKFCRRNPALHIYSIGDLDDFFWKYTTWLGLTEENTISELVLLYQGFSIPTVLGISENTRQMKEFLNTVSGFLPRRFIAHLSPGTEEALVCHYSMESHGEFHKMVLEDGSKVVNADFSGVDRLSSDDRGSILELYERSYPESWFDQRMLDTNQYFGIHENGKLVSIAGVHVYSRKHRVAALGNITTHPDWRGKGLGKKVTRVLCRSLSETTDYIGLNVKSDNIPAIRLYESLGFRKIASYNEFAAKAT